MFFGDNGASNSLEDAQFSKLQVMFGNNPLETRMSGGGELGVHAPHVLQRLVEAAYRPRDVVHPDAAGDEVGVHVPGQRQLPVQHVTDAAAPHREVRVVESGL